MGLFASMAPVAKSLSPGWVILTLGLKRLLLGESVDFQQGVDDLVLGPHPRDGEWYPLVPGQADGQGIHLNDFPVEDDDCLLYTSPSPRDRQKSRMPSSA